MTSILHRLGQIEQAGIVELDPRTMSDVVRLIDEVGEEHPVVLAHSLAARLTHDATRQAHVLRMLLPEKMPEAPVSPPVGPEAPSPTGRLRVVSPEVSGGGWRVPAFLRDLSGKTVLALLGLSSLAIVIGGPFATRAVVAEIDPSLVPQPPPKADEVAPTPAPPLELPKPEPQTVTPTTRLDPLDGEPGRRGELKIDEERPVDPPGPPWLAASLFLGGLVVLVVAAVWWSAPAHYRALVRRARERAREQREQWNRQGHVSAVPYHIERAPPFSPAHIDDAATVLGRLFRREPGLDLDVLATVDATIDAGGRITPVFAAGRVRENLLVFVDRENRQHPYLDGVEWLLARWRRLGLRFLRFDYHKTLDALHPERGPAVSLDELRRQAESLPLLVFSRMRDARAYQGRVALARALDAWPLRAWLDLDPTPLAERDRELQRDARALASAGVPRYPFTEAGLVAAARSLAEGAPRHRLVAEPVVPPAGAEDTALMVWAGTAACVPDASWAQLEAVRRHFDGFVEVTAGAAPLDARALERLLAWIAARKVHSGALGEGERLYFTPAGRRWLLRELRRFDRARWPNDPDARFEARARCLLIDQLRAADVGDDPYREALRNMKVAVHEAVLDPARAEALLRGFADKAVVYELIEQLEDELALQADEASTLRRWSSRDREALTAFVQGAARARVPDLLRWPSRSQAAVGLGLSLASAASWALWLYVQPSTRPVVQARSVEVPPSWKVVIVAPESKDELVALADVAPMRFKRLPGGVFTMGSGPAERKMFKKLDRTLEDSDFADERQHEVEVSGFELGVTEVTNAQWRAVMGSSPSRCAYGCDENHPVQNVSWVMAVEFLNKLTDRENEGRPEAARLTRCYEPSGEGWGWVEGCTGYRLPTEAEWEYAARAGSRSAYSFGDDPRALCEYGNGADYAAGREHPTWTVNKACSDGAANLAEVGTYAPNAWGLHDMHGNVWEWVWDWYHDKYGGNDGEKVTRSPRGPLRGVHRVLRGGSFRDVHWRLRSANRSGGGLSLANVYTGFRCGRGSPPSP